MLKCLCISMYSLKKSHHFSIIFFLSTTPKVYFYDKIPKATEVYMNSTLQFCKLQLCERIFEAKRRVKTVAVYRFG